MSDQIIRSSKLSLMAWALVAGLLLALVFWGGTALGQAEIPQQVTADDVNAVARELWCPLCSGVRLDSCELKACDQMKEVIAIKLSEGEDTASIKDYFIGQYGPQVLGEPPREGFNWLAWILPVVAAVGGGFIFWGTARRLMRPRGSRMTEAPGAARPASEDDYDRKLEEELAKHG